MTVTNPYYEFDPGFIPFTKARAGDNNLQFQAIQNAFDLLPSDSDALTTDTATFGPESGSGNVYVVTLADTRTSNQDGDGVRFFATHTNTGPSTLNIDAIGAIALVNWTGTVLGGGEIVSGRIYEVRYDAANVQYVISASTDGAIQVGYAEEWAIKAEDVPVSTAAGGNGTTDFSSFHWSRKSLASAITGRVNTDIVTATPPTTEAVTGAFEIFDAVAEDDDLLMRLGFQASNTLVLRNLMHGGDFQLSVETAAGVEVPYKFSDTRMAIPNAVGVTFDDSGAVERESLILETGAGGDANFTEVELLADGDGADAATSYTERSLNGAVATFVGNAQLDTAQFKFGTASFLMDGTGDYVTFPDDVSLELGSGEFTLEGWVRFNTLPLDNERMSLLSQWEGVGSDRAFNVFIQKHPVFDFSIGFEWEDVGNGIESGSIDPLDPVINQWFHWAVIRDANDALFMWWDGAREFNSAPGIFDGAIDNSTVTVKFGTRDPGDAGNEEFLDGWVDDVRITVGVERYDTSGDITTPAAAFPTTGVSDVFKVGNTAIQTVILGSGGEAAQTIAAASGGLQVNNTLTGAGLERVLTDSDISTGGAAVDAQYRFSTTTTEADPGNGRFRMDNATPASVTELFISSTTDNNNDFDNMLGFLSAGDQIYIQQDNDATKFLLFDVTANVDNTGWFSIAGTTSVSGTILDNNAKSHILLLFGGTSGASGRVTTDINTATPPTTEAVTGGFEIFDADETDKLMELGYTASNTLDLTNLMHGGAVRLTAQNAAGAGQVLVEGDPDGVTTLYAAGIHRFNAQSAGRVAIRSDTSTDAEVRQLLFDHQDGSCRAIVGHLASDIFVIRNEIHNGEINIVQEDGAGADLIAFSYDASSGQVELNGANVVRLGFGNGEQAMRAQVNSFLTLHHNNIEVLRTTTTALGGVTVHNLLTGSGAERVATVPGDVLPTQYKVKTANELISSSTTMQDDDHIFGYNLVADKYYAIEGCFICSGSTGDLDFLFDFTNARQSGRVSHFLSDDTIHTTAENFNQSIQLEHLVILGSGSQMVHIIGWFLSNATTGGTMKMRWAQNSSSGTATNMQSGTWVRITQMN